MCDYQNQETKFSQWKLDLMSNYFKNEERVSMNVPKKSVSLKTIDVDEDFESVYYDNEIDDETVEYEIIRSPKSLKKIAASAIHNDSGYEGLETSGRKSPMGAVKHGMDTRKRPPPLDAETVARMFDCHDKCGDMRTRMVEAVAVLLMVFSVILSVLMGHGDESNLGGKRAAIQFYYDSLELERNGVY